MRHHFSTFVRNPNLHLQTIQPSTSPIMVGRVWMSPRWKEPEEPTTTYKRLRAQYDYMTDSVKLTHMDHIAVKDNAIKLIQRLDMCPGPEEVMQARVQGLQQFIESANPYDPPDEGHFSDSAPDYSPMVHRMKPQSSSPKDNSPGPGRRVTRLQQKRAGYTIPPVTMPEEWLTSPSAGAAEKAASGRVSWFRSTSTR